MSESEERPETLIEEAPSMAWLAFERGVFILAILYLISPLRHFFADMSVLGCAAILLFFFSESLCLKRREAKASRSADVSLLCFTIFAAALIWGYGLFFAKVDFSWGHLLMTLLVYVPFAWLQHVGMQRYVVSRHCETLGEFCKTRFGFRSSLGITLILSAVIFGFFHIPFPNLVLPTTVAGLIWTYYYLETGRLMPIALSHAFLATSLFFLYLERDPFRALGHFVPGS
ncbi:MAG: CPBP family intramembrane metalloprotease [Planctomycetota bacterium]|nr:CPBP family intramembrane metalloprotease [Planctomycetota bacterium]